MSVVLLGSTGSIGKNSLEILKKFNIEVEALVAGSNYKLLNKQIKEFKPKYVIVKNKEVAKFVEFKDVKYGKDAILDVIEKSKSDIVINALVGEAGLEPTLKAQSLKKTIALANKESLVIAGKFIDTSKVVPIDSEHFGLWYLLNDRKDFKKLYITASGGALRDWDIKKIEKATLQDVLKHPNWKMGTKITIDSATMVNKLFEILEAKWLFGSVNIDAFIETKSIIHALIDWVDGSTTAHISKTDMKLPIAYAILNEVTEPILDNVNLLEVAYLEFKKIDTLRYPLWNLKELLLNNPDLGVVLNSANEIAVKNFIESRFSFIEISKFIFEVIKEYENIKINSIDELFFIQNEIKAKYENYTF